MNCPSICPYKVPAGTAMQMLGLGLIAGGMLAIGAFTAPAVFAHFPRHEAGVALVGVFRKYDVVLLLSLGLILLGEALRFCSGAFRTRHVFSVVRYIVMCALTLALLYSTLCINARIENLHRTGVRPGSTPQGLEFMSLHKTSETLYKAEMFLAVLLILLTPFVPTASRD